MTGKKRTVGAAISSVPNPRSVKTSPPRLSDCPFLELSPDGLGELMSPTLDSDLSVPSQRTPGSGLSGPDYDDFLAVLGAERYPRRPGAGKRVRHSLMVHSFNWS
jgi:hypothetical protein